MILKKKKKNQMESHPAAPTSTRPLAACRPAGPGPQLPQEPYLLLPGPLPLPSLLPAPLASLLICRVPACSCDRLCTGGCPAGMNAPPQVPAQFPPSAPSGLRSKSSSQRGLAWLPDLTLTLLIPHPAPYFCHTYYAYYLLLVFLC